MFIKNLLLKNFRNYSQENFSFISGINVLTGSNAQGKTNLAEAIFFLCTGYSPRANKDKLVIKNGCEQAFVKGTACSRFGDCSVELRFNKNDKKQVFINDLEVLKIGELMGNINSVFFNPSELKLVQEAPEDRRRFLNISLSQKSKSYFYALARYNKILSQRNNLLKQPSELLIRDTLPIWDVQLSKEAGKIIKARNDFLNVLAPIANQKHSLLSLGKEDLQMQTESEYSGTSEEIASSLLKDLKNNVDKDIRLGFTSIGPHRDDIKFTLNGLDAKVYASQGQQRSVALSIKLAEAETFKTLFGEYPILILDDVLSELDRARQKKLIELITPMQTIFTTTHIDRTVFKGISFRQIVIENGQIKKIKD